MQKPWCKRGCWRFLSSPPQQEKWPHSRDWAINEQPAPLCPHSTFRRGPFSVNLVLPGICVFSLLSKLLIRLPTAQWRARLLISWTQNKLQRSLEPTYRTQGWLLSRSQSFWVLSDLWTFISSMRNTRRNLIFWEKKHEFVNQSVKNACWEDAALNSLGSLKIT